MRRLDAALQAERLRSTKAASSRRTPKVLYPKLRTQNISCHMQHLQKILQEKVLPWAKAGAAERIIIARQRMSAAEMPSGVQLTYHKIPGKRVIVKSGRNYGNTRLISAKWPESGMHEVENARFICVAEGNMNYQVGNYLLHCKAGDFIFLPPRFPHPGNKHFPPLAYSTFPGEVCTLLFMAQYHRGLQCWQSQYGNEHRKDSAAENYLFLKGQVIQLFELLIEELQTEKNAALCNSLLLSLMTSLSREVSAGRYLHPGPIVKRETSGNVKNEFIQHLEEYIEQHLNEHLTLESISHHFYTSRAQFVRQVRKETGKTFVEFLTDYRIREAKTLLRESEWTVQTIAHFVGFKSPVYFHRLFVKQADCTPGQYRLENKSR